MSSLPAKSGGGGGEKFSVQRFCESTVKGSIVPLLKKPEDWPAWLVGLRSAILRDDAQGGGKLRLAFERNPESALVSLAKCARLGLCPDPALDHFALIPYGSEVTGAVMYRGWMFLMLASGQVEWLHADVIYRQEVVPGMPLRDPMTDRILHVANDLERDTYKDDDIAAAYAMCKLKGSERIVSVLLTRGNINKRRAASKAPNSPGWTKWFPQMCCAKAFQALGRCGRVPLTPQLREALQDDEEELKPAVLSSPPTTAPLVPPPAVPPPAARLPKQSGGQYLFDETEKDPLPSDEVLRERRLNALSMELVNRDISDDELAQLIQRAFKKGRVEDLSTAQLDELFDLVCAPKEES